jgi:hypothetical protein
MDGVQMMQGVAHGAFIGATGDRTRLTQMRQVLQSSQPTTTRTAENDRLTARQTEQRQPVRSSK